METVTWLKIQMGFTVLAIVFSFTISIYSIYLNWKQAKVEAQMKILIQEVRNIHNTMKNTPSISRWSRTH